MTDQHTLAAEIATNTKAEVHKLAHNTPDAPEDLSYAIVPDGMTVQSLKKLTDEHAKRPERRQGTTLLHSTVSLVAFANRFKNENSVIFSDRERA